MMLLIDVGGSNTRIAVSERDGTIENPAIFPTEKEFDAGINKIVETAATLLAGGKPEVVIIGITGQVSDAGELIKSPNLPTWEDRDLKNVLYERFDAPAYVLNDAQLGAAGEATAGAGKGASVVLYMTLGTGIGFARTIDGMPDLTIGSETGHQYIDIDGEHLVEAEDLVSGRALKEKLHIGGEDMHDTAVWEEYARLAAIPLYNNILAFAPDAVVVGGSLVKDGSLQVSILAEHVGKIATHLTRMPTIVRATLGDLCGLYGAQAYGRSNLS